MKLFLDDYRIPIDCATYMFRSKIDCKIYHEKWIIVRSYKQFCEAISKELPSVVSFDYDLTDVEELKELLSKEEWFNEVEQRDYKGSDCLIWLITYCKENNYPLPNCILHTANSEGLKLMKILLNTV